MLQKTDNGQKKKIKDPKKTLLLLLLAVLSQPAMAQESDNNLPRIEGYTKGELKIKINTFGMDNPITVGKVAADGVIHFSWPELNSDNIDEDAYLTKSLKHYIGLNFCKDANAAITNEDAQLVGDNYLYLFKYGQRVGLITPSTQQLEKGQGHRKDQMGSTIHWIYSNVEASATANCSEKKEWEDLYSFDETTAYDLNFKKGWNLVSDTLIAIEEWEADGRKSSLPKTKAIRSIEKIPTELVWHLNYTANDELLEIEQQLLAGTPITKQGYKNWLPKKLGKLKRTGYEIGKEIERIDTDSNVNLLFAKGAKKIDLTIVDAAGSKGTVGMFTMMYDMASRDWRDKTDTGYRSAAEIDGKRVLTDYNKIEVKTGLSYNVNNRFMVKAEAENMTPEELWEHLQALDFEALIKG